MSKRFRVKGLARDVALIFGAGMAASLVSTPALGQQDAQRLERVEVTGSAVKRIQAETALPVQTFSRTEIERTGATSISELIQNLPGAQGGFELSQDVGNGIPGYSGASLRNQGSSRTLILLNGRRIANFGGVSLAGFGSGVDLNTIPIAAVERVEILLDGASALYGADAIGGVINFILRSSATDGEATVMYSKPQHGGGVETRISATKGFGDLAKDGFNVLLSASAEKGDTIRATERDFAKTGILRFSEGGKNYEFFNGSPRGIPANVVVGGQLKNPYLLQNGTCPPQHAKVGDACYFDYTASLEIQPSYERQNFVASFNKTLGQNHTLFADFVWSNFNSISKIAPPPGAVTIRPDSPFFGPAASVGATGPVSAFWRVADVGGRTTKADNTAMHFAAGLKGLAMGWDYQTSYTYSINDYESAYVGGWLKLTELGAATSSGKLNPFLTPGQQSAEAMQLLKAAQYLGPYRSGKTTLQFFELRGSREAFRLPAGPAMLAAGLDYRIEQANYSPSEIAQGIGNNIFGDSGFERPFDVKRNAWGAFAELLTPVAKNLELTTSVRHDKYSDFGDTTNGKVAMRWQPTRDFLVRGSMGTGFRAPSVPETSNARQPYGVTGDNYTCPFPASDPLGAICPPGNVQYQTFAAGNPSLKPEKSNQWSLGARWEPVNNVSVGFDTWQIRVRDMIGSIGEDVIFKNPAKYRNLFTQFTDPGTDITELAISLPNVNLGRSDTRGTDIDARVRFNTAAGRLTSRFFGTFIHHYNYQLVPGEDYYSDLNKFFNGGVTFRFIGRWINTLEHGNFAHTLTLNYKSGYVDQEQTVTDLSTGEDVDLVRKVKEYVTADWQTRWNMRKDVRLTLGVRNLTDTRPPLSLKTVGGQQVGYDNRFTDARGRTVYLTGSYLF